MTTDTQTLIDAVAAGGTAGPGGMPTTRNVADVVPFPYDVVAEKLRALELEGVLERTTFGGDRVWRVSGEEGDDPGEETADRAISTTTRDPLTT